MIFSFVLFFALLSAEVPPARAQFFGAGHTFFRRATRAPWFQLASFGLTVPRLETPAPTQRAQLVDAIVKRNEDELMKKVHLDPADPTPRIQAVKKQLMVVERCIVQAALQDELGAEQKGWPAPTEFQLWTTQPAASSFGSVDFTPKLDTFPMHNTINVCIRLDHDSILARIQCANEGLICNQELQWSNRVVQVILSQQRRGSWEVNRLDFGRLSGVRSGDETEIEKRVERARHMAFNLALDVTPGLAVFSLGWIAAVIFFGLVIAAIVLILVMGLVMRFFRDRKSMLGLTLLTFVAAGLQLAYWSLQVEAAGADIRIGMYKRMLVLDILSRTSSIVYLALIAFLSTVILVAMKKAFDLSNALPLIAGVSFTVATVFAAAYSIALTIVNLTGTQTFVPDFTLVVLAAISLALSSCMTVFFGVILRNLGEGDGTESSRLRKRNALIFVLVTAAISVLYLARLILACLVTWKNAERFLMPLTVVDFIAVALTTLAVLAYLFFAVRGARRQKILASPEDEGYALMDQSKVPAQYDV